jgi:hypothetical protein
MAASYDRWDDAGECRYPEDLSSPTRYDHRRMQKLRGGKNNLYNPPWPTKQKDAKSPVKPTQSANWQPSKALNKSYATSLLLDTTPCALDATPPVGV